MKTTLNPSMNPTEFSMTLRSSCASCDLSSSTPAPEIKDTYPGTRGSTQGERNDTNPATKAAIGRGRLVILNYCTRSDRAVMSKVLISPRSLDIGNQDKASKLSEFFERSSWCY